MQCGSRPVPDSIATVTFSMLDRTATSSNAAGFRERAEVRWLRSMKRADQSEQTTSGELIDRCELSR